jgi:hypothetical protein
MRREHLPQEIVVELSSGPSEPSTASVADSGDVGAVSAERGSLGPHEMEPVLRAAARSSDRRQFAYFASGIVCAVFMNQYAIHLHPELLDVYSAGQSTALREVMLLAPGLTSMAAGYIFCGYDA